ncbi:5-oxoprolinase/urea amidolyase family protein [Arthrobacter agilis]|uniref:5-oxoprolinase subunit B/C family protein n=1 Tax=Arthrobacter agilis TaxID=37921 RepID=UPI000B360CAD|nr:5-oxoprolinase/urea amidolyase family protein [Arthrobacter agilis]OUM42238.1 urea amidolyase [Arthrobacter agilis]PPB45581.1 urea amidolyase [Arthrobacter agilis]TPV26438.1 5-oxoprolinase/urea amidolyase family protein [Arthrobacter agilis]VDR33664.1 Sporulation inhibitor kipI [Arthrobacter agilis]
MTLRPVGDRGLLVELPGLLEVLSVQAQLHADPADGQVDVVAAARTVLVTVQAASNLRALRNRLLSLDPTVPVEQEDALVTLEVQYDGEDLAEVARRSGLSEEAVVSAHTSRPWIASFGGFAPGFAYLTGGDPRLEVPRRETPRTAVPAGSVALAGTFSAVYPRVSPGGWQLIGHTDAVLWDTHREAPALIRPGNRVRFVAVRDRVLVRADASGPTPTGTPDATRAARGEGLAVVHPGLSSTLQDLGRPGHMSLGVAEAGALDRSAARQANRLVGNPAGAAVIESLNGGLVLEAGEDHVVAVTGADVGLVITAPDGRERAALLCAPFLLRGAEVLRQSAPASGLRTYTAVRGGFAEEQTLGSRSTDTMSGLGPAPLVAGSRLVVAAQGAASAVGVPELPRPLASPEILRVIPGPRDDWFGAESLERLLAADWTVTAQSDRIGLRLDGPALLRTREGELLSEGTMRGALQVPPSGRPVLFLADHPVTGGYPVIAVVVSADLDRAAQLAPGSVMRFRAADS